MPPDLPKDLPPEAEEHLRRYLQNKELPPGASEYLQQYLENGELPPGAAEYLRKYVENVAAAEPVGVFADPAAALVTDIHNLFAWLLLIGLVIMVPRLFRLHSRRQPFARSDRVAIGVLGLAYFQLILSGTYLSWAASMPTRVAHVVLGLIPICGILWVLTTLAHRVPVPHWRVQRMFLVLFIAGIVLTTMARWISIGETRLFGLIWWPFPELFPVWFRTPGT